MRQPTPACDAGERHADMRLITVLDVGNTSGDETARKGGIRPVIARTGRIPIFFLTDHRSYEGITANIEYGGHRVAPWAAATGASIAHIACRLPHRWPDLVIGDSGFVWCYAQRIKCFHIAPPSLPYVSTAHFRVHINAQYRYKARIGATEGTVQGDFEPSRPR